MASRVLTVVGVVKDVKRNWYERDIASTVYLPDAQWGSSSMQVLLRTTRFNPVLLTCFESARGAGSCRPAWPV